MFASMCEFPEFYKKHMMRYVAIAPVVFANHLTSRFINKHINDEWIITAVKKSMGIECFTLSGASNFVTKTFQATSGGKLMSGKVCEEISDSKSHLINENGNENYLRFFPSGTSLQCFLHFKQMVIDGIFRKFDYGADINQ